jgi:hypothetical protein
MADLTWEGNSEKMFEAMVEGSPKPFRASTRKKLTKGLEEKAGDGGSVTEDMVIECVKEITPKPFVAMALKKLEPLKS